MNPPTLAVDIGQSGTRLRWRHREDERETTILPTQPHLGQPAVPSQIVGQVVSAWRAVGSPPATRLLMGITGWTADSASALLDELLPIVAATSGIAADDAVTAYLGALGDRPGVNLAAGTGVTALGVGGDPSPLLVGGWGPMIDDGGGGFWVGHRGLNEAVRSLERRGGSAALRSRAEERFGSLRQLKADLSRAAYPTAVVAGFAVDVAAAAEAGDHIARDIWAQAGKLLAEVAARATRSFGDQPVPVACTGGLTLAGPPLLEAFWQNLRVLAPASEPTHPIGSGLDGAMQLANEDIDRRFADLIVRRERP